MSPAREPEVQYVTIKPMGFVTIKLLKYCPYFFFRKWDLKAISFRYVQRRKIEALQKILPSP